ncbi:Retrovirus-related Pol polyprotein from transposon opus, partial [Mucuna pruriens]
MVTKGIVLRHLVSARGVEVDKAKIDVISSLPNPASMWEPCVDAFQELKRRLTSAPILQAPNWELLFKLMCDTSNFALRAILGQQVGKQPHVIAYASRTMDAAQVNYTTNEKELLSIMFALDKLSVEVPLEEARWPRKSLTVGYISPPYTKMHTSLSQHVNNDKESE